MFCASLWIVCRCAYILLYVKLKAITHPVEKEIKETFVYNEMASRTPSAKGKKKRMKRMESGETRENGVLGTRSVEIGRGREKCGMEIMKVSNEGEIETRYVKNETK